MTTPSFLHCAVLAQATLTLYLALGNKTVTGLSASTFVSLQQQESLESEQMRTLFAQEPATAPHVPQRLSGSHTDLQGSPGSCIPVAAPLTSHSFT